MTQWKTNKLTKDKIEKMSKEELVELCCDTIQDRDEIQIELDEIAYDNHDLMDEVEDLRKEVKKLERKLKKYEN